MCRYLPVILWASEPGGVLHLAGDVPGSRHALQGQAPDAARELPGQGSAV